MKNNNIFKKFWDWLFPAHKPNHRGKPTASDSSMMPVVMHMLENTEEIELSCDEVFELLDQYAELAKQGQDVTHLMPLVERHLHMCPDCREEYEALERILKAPIHSDEQTDL